LGRALRSSPRHIVVRKIYLHKIRQTSGDSVSLTRSAGKCAAAHLFRRDYLTRPSVSQGAAAA
jgi:hypothetical protein